MRSTTRIITEIAVVTALGLGALGYAVAEAPDGAGTAEAVRVALDPGIEYAVLHVKGMR